RSEELCYKPSQSLSMSFAGAPNPGLMANRFSGPAIVFLATTTFTTQSTAAFAIHTTAFRLSIARHTQSVQIGVEHFLLLAALVRIQLAQSHDRAQRLCVEAGSFGLGVDVPYIV